MNYFSHPNQFEGIIKRLFQVKGYEVESNFPYSRDYDFVFLNESSNRVFVECKFYRSNNVSNSVLFQSVKLLAQFIHEKSNSLGILITNSIVPGEVRMVANNKYGIQIYDHSFIMGELANLSLDLKDEYERLLLESQQFTTEHSVNKNDERILITEYTRPIGNLKIPVPSTKGKELADELREIECGKTGWSRFESKCLEILKHLFNDDLTLWEMQNRTDDKLSRFDMICRIGSKDDFWNSLISAFNSRFVLFEFKNYCDPIDQSQVYTTERYLYVKALRSVAYIIARNGASASAIAAAKGALKEHGKLIIIITEDDLLKMLELKDNGDSPNDYLAEKLDRWLIGLSR